MKKLFLFLFFCFAFGASVMAQKTEHFFYEEIPGWLLLGEKNSDKKILVCHMETGKRETGLMEFGYTFVENYFYLVFHSNTLNLSRLSDNGEHTVQLSLLLNNGKVESAPATAIKLNDKTVIMPHVIPEAFFPYFLNSTSIKIAFSDNIGELSLSIAGVKDSFERLGKCAEKALEFRKTNERGA